MTGEDGDLVLVPKGHHPCAAPYGHEMYYLNVIPRVRVPRIIANDQALRPE
jgi:5-deoxy-D-glucuronate isomerase